MAEAAGSAFEKVAAQLCNELVGQLTSEHSKEVGRMYGEVMALRQELQNVKDLLEGYLVREEVLATMVDDLTNHHNQAIQGFMTLHQDFHANATNALKGAADMQKNGPNPIQDAQKALQIVDQILQKPVVTGAGEMHLHNYGR
mmetsp:Transcript_13898/g.30678  ORF Transcript_13898/g.30678 Transcript_13898/m.30678 type:complete len:143 (+) Transcript_13898:88-516(+)